MDCKILKELVREGMNTHHLPSGVVYVLDKWTDDLAMDPDSDVFRALVKLIYSMEEKNAQIMADFLTVLTPEQLEILELETISHMGHIFKDVVSKRYNLRKISQREDQADPEHKENS